MSRDPAGPDEFVDAELSRRLGDAAGRLPDTNVALSSLRARVVAARRRRLRGAVTALVVGIVGVGSMAAVQSRRNMTDVQSDRPVFERSVEVTTSSAPPPTTMPATTAAPPTTSAPASTVPSTPVTDSMPPLASEPEPEPITVPAGEAPAEPSAEVPAAPVAPTPTAAASPQAGTSSQTVTSQGGSIVVVVVDDELVLGEVWPAAGYQVTRQEVGRSRLVVVLASSQLISTVRVELVDGHAEASVDERSGGGDDGHDRDGRDRGDGDHHGSSSTPTPTPGTGNQRPDPAWGSDPGGRDGHDRGDRDGGRHGDDMGGRHR